MRMPSDHRRFCASLKWPNSSIYFVVLVVALLIEPANYQADHKCLQYIALSRQFIFELAVDSGDPLVRDHLGSHSRNTSMSLLSELGSWSVSNFMLAQIQSPSNEDRTARESQCSSLALLPLSDSANNFHSPFTSRTSTGL